MIDINEITHTIINADCMDILKQLPDKCIDLVLTDPPYGKQYARGKNGFGVCNENLPDLKDVAWDKHTPTQETFNEIIRVSKNQIIFGGNYFTDKLPVSNCWLVWDKIGTHTNKSPFADCELAWTSFNTVCKKFVSVSLGFIRDDKTQPKIHPTQKPLPLFEQILDKYSKANDLILDCYSGSGTTAIACLELKRRYILIEKDTQYYQASLDRVADYQKQPVLF